MPKRPAPTATAMSADIQVPPAKVQKTERSHEENQERAYIAASRRADRSLEARVQSAKMASEIHRRRTGRGLKVSEEIVLKEEMYEEEEDDLPRSYRQLTAHLQTSSPEMNSRFSAYVSTQTALATMQRYNEVNRLFRDAFSPTAVAYQQQLNNSVYMAPLFNNGVPSPSNSRDPMSAAQPQFDGGNRKTSTNSPSHRTDTTATIGSVSTPPAAASPTSRAMNSSDGKGKSAFNMPEAGSSNLPLDPQLRQQPTSSFTSELPNEIKMLGNFDMSDPLAIHFFGEASPALQMLNEQGDMPEWNQVHAGLTELHTPATQHSQDDQYFSPGTNSVADFDSLPSEAFGHNDPATEGYDDWETWLNLESNAAVQG
ncbi:hypothetical protein GGR57DRAFT_399424 [Xylariaceae sp. FL1272]|nr:hypothetical protein GGR57DRAFT_399424 [Xylariaceae sp. FL1272]